MNAKPLSPEEILELLPRLAATDKDSSLLLASTLSGVSGVSGVYGEVRYLHERWKLLELGFPFKNLQERIHTYLHSGFLIRITIPRPPKRGAVRVIRRDEMPEIIQIQWAEGSIETPAETALRFYLLNIDTFKVTHWSDDDGKTWKSIWVQDPDEPQEPLVISTEEL